MAESTGSFEKPLYTELLGIQFGSVPYGLGSPGLYEVTIVFRHPIQAAGQDETLLRAADKEGDSAIGISGPIALSIPTPDVPSGRFKLDLMPNARGQLGKAKATLHANHLGHARSIVSSQVGALLSRLSFEADASVAMDQWEVRELATGREEVSVIVRGQTRRFSGLPVIRVAPPFFRSAFSVYREGLNSVNPYYALLCFYRVIEGSRAYGAKQVRYAKTHGITHERAKQVVEDVDGIRRDFPVWLGRSCEHVAEQLYKLYRVPVAHGLEAGSSLHAPDQLLEEDRYWRAVPLARQIARKLLLREWRLRGTIGLSHIPELDGNTPAS